MNFIADPPQKKLTVSAINKIFFVYVKKLPSGKMTTKFAYVKTKAMGVRLARQPRTKHNPRSIPSSYLIRYSDIKKQGVFKGRAPAKRNTFNKR